MNITANEQQYITDGQGNKTAIILPMDAYNELLEDLSDLAAVVERRNDDTTSHTDLIASLKADGLF